MSFTYKKLKHPLSGEIVTNTILRKEDNAFIPFDEGNTAYQEYKLWLEEGNTPEAAD